MANYREENRERLKILCRENYAENREARLATRRLYYLKNKKAHAEAGKIKFESISRITGSVTSFG